MIRLVLIGSHDTQQGRWIARRSWTRTAGLGPCAAVLIVVIVLTATKSAVAGQQPSEPQPPATPARSTDDAQTIAITGRQLGGFVLPIEPLDGETRFRAMKAHSWVVDDTNRLYLEGNVRIAVGGHRFSADEAVVWLNRLPSEGGVINQIAMYFGQLKESDRRAGTQAYGEDVLVTASIRGETSLEAAVVEQGRPERRPLLREGEGRLREHLQRLAAAPPPLRRRPQAEHPPPEPDFLPRPGDRVEDLPESVLRPPQEDQDLPLFEPDGMIRFLAGRIDTPLPPGEDEDVVVLTGGVVVEYTGEGADGQWTELTLKAEHAVVFTEPDLRDQITRGQFEAGMIRQIYLEGNVLAATAGDEYQVRAPRVFYDVQRDEALMVDTVLRTHSRNIDAPIYSRAREMRQVARNQWTARDARVSTSEFYTPHIALGAQRVTVTQIEDEYDRERTELAADGTTLRVGGVPVFYWPRFVGRLQDVPLRSVTISEREYQGFGIASRWNVFGLLDRPTPPGVDATLRLDAYSKRGIGGGLDTTFDIDGHEASSELYGIWDSGDDRTNAGRTVDRDSATFRGEALWEHHGELGRDWTLQTQVSYISDETFVTMWRPDDFQNRREYETSAYLKHQHENAALTALGKYELNDFISNDSLLASRQRQVDRLPEATYQRFGDSWFDDRVTYSGSIGASRMRFRFERHSPAELGVRAGGFGIDPDTPFSTVLAEQNLHEQTVTRGHTRHEIAMPLQWDQVQLTPFMTGRASIYDDDFSEFSSDADDMRFFGAGGLRASTELQRIYEDVESRLFDLHRLRHLVEPHATLWYGYSTVSNNDLPTYDPLIEDAGDTSALAMGVRNTWQTKRGGPGRWTNVDVLRVDSQVVLNGSDANRRSPHPRFFDYRPEYSQFGDHVYTSAIWLPSDTLSMLGEMTYDLDESTFTRSSVGMELRHSPILQSIIEYRNINASGTELLGVGWAYQVTPKYYASVRPEWDFRAGQFRRVRLYLTRSFPDFELVFQVDYDDIRGETTMGLTLGRVDF